MGTKTSLIASRNALGTALMAIKSKIGGDTGALSEWFGVIMLSNAIASRVHDWIELAAQSPAYDPIIAGLDAASAALAAAKNAAARLAAIRQARAALVPINGLLDADD